MEVGCESPIIGSMVAFEKRVLKENICVFQICTPEKNNVPY